MLKFLILKDNYEFVLRTPQLAVFTAQELGRVFFLKRFHPTPLAELSLSIHCILALPILFVSSKIESSYAIAMSQADLPAMKSIA